MSQLDKLFETPEDALAYSSAIRRGEDAVKKLVNRNQLAHYGVKGMKWGVRKDRVGTLTPEETRVIVSTALIAGYAIKKARYNYIDSGKQHQKRLDKAAKKAGVEHSWNRKESLVGPKSVEQIEKDIIPAINKGFPNEPGTSMNCRRCTYAYEMRRRGYDVKATRTLKGTGQDSTSLEQVTRPSDASRAEKKANRLDPGAWGRNEIKTYVGKKQMPQEKKVESIFNTLANQPNGSRGELSMGWVFFGGHSVAYEIVNNKPVVFDTQSGKTYRDTKTFNKDLGPMVGEAAFTRLDNIKLNDDFLKRWLDHAN